MSPTIRCLNARAAGSQTEGVKVRCLLSWQLSFLVESSLEKFSFVYLLISSRWGTLMVLVLLSSQSICTLTSNPF